MTSKLSNAMTPREQTFGWVYWAFQLIALPLILDLVNDYFGTPMTELELNFLYFSLNVLILVAFMGKFFFSSCGKGLLRPFRTLRIACVGFVLYWLASLGVSYLVLQLDPDFANINDMTIAGLVGQDYTLSVIGMVFMAPVAEEILYRGVIFGSIYPKNKFLAYACSIVLFAAIHVVGYIGMYDWDVLGLCALQYLPAGFFLAWTYARTGSILAPILIHISVNQIGILAMR